MTPLRNYTADHRYLLELVGREAGFDEPMAVELDEFHGPVMKAARKGKLLPIDGVLVRDWDPDSRRTDSGIKLGLRLYQIEGVRFVQVRAAMNDEQNPERSGLEFVAVDRKNYRALYRIALRCRRDFEPPGLPPVLPPEQAECLWRNTIGYLDRGNLGRIKAYGGRAKRGVLMTGAPGNGKTMACRWIWQECRRRRWDWRLVTPDAYCEARRDCNPQKAVRELFAVERRGVVFFDDMDLALRDRETVQETDDQAVFLGALDGIATTEGVVYVFTTNCELDLIDRAFKRPGRLDLVLHFKAPDATLRRLLMDRWHADIRNHIDLEHAVTTTDGYSFAEIEELKNLLILRFMETDRWDWTWAMKQFDINRAELAKHRHKGHVGFGRGAPQRNGERVVS